MCNFNLQSSTQDLDCNWNRRLERAYFILPKTHIRKASLLHDTTNYHISMESKSQIMNLMLCTIVSTFVIGDAAAFPTGFETALTERKRAVTALAVLAMGGSKTPSETRISSDLIEHVVGFTMKTDWHRLSEVFHRTDTTRGILEFAERQIHGLDVESYSTGFIPNPNGKQEGQIITNQFNGRGSIVLMDLRGFGLRQEDIRDWSKLPPSLKCLKLDNNLLKTFDFEDLPRGLVELHLSNNPNIQFVGPGFRGLPPGLEELILRDNGLRQIHFDQIPHTVKYLDVSGNHITHVNLSKLHQQRLQLRLSNNDWLTHIDLRRVPKGTLLGMWMNGCPLDKELTKKWKQGKECPKGMKYHTQHRVHVLYFDDYIY